MPRYVVLSTLSAQGQRALKNSRHELPDISAEVEELGGKVLDQYALLGTNQFLTIVDVRDNDTSHQLRVAPKGGETSARELWPAIDLDLFVRLMSRSTENTGPYRWQISLPARCVRRVLRSYAYTGAAAKYFKPLRIIGQEKLASLRGPVIFVANHASFMDVNAMYVALPKRYQSRCAFPAAADRFFVKGRKELRKQGWWFSLVYNSFPMRRGGGSAALDHADWLIQKGWSIGIFPEGARTSAGKLARFRLGPAILALRHDLPVVPMFLDGLKDVRAKGSRQLNQAPVTIYIGDPVRLDQGLDAPQATRVLFHAVDDLRKRAAGARRLARAEAAVASGNGSNRQLETAPAPAPAASGPAGGA